MQNVAGDRKKEKKKKKTEKSLKRIKILLRKEKRDMNVKCASGENWGDDEHAVGDWSRGDARRELVETRLDRLCSAAEWKAQFKSDKAEYLTEETVKQCARHGLFSLHYL